MLCSLNALYVADEFSLQRIFFTCKFFGPKVVRKIVALNEFNLQPILHDLINVRGLLNLLKFYHLMGTLKCYMIIFVSPEFLKTEKFEFSN